MGRLTEIGFVLPGGAEWFLDGMRGLLGGVTYASGRSVLILTPPRPDGALPVTTMRLGAVPAPRVTLGPGVTLETTGGERPDADIEMADLVGRLAGHVGRVDHFGVNLPAAAWPDARWDELVATVAAGTTMYRYPTGEPWPFVLPSTPDELGDGIRDFVVGREPRFELVHDGWAGHTTWQFALWTALSREELEQRFPEGRTLPGLEDFFRTVFVRHPWPGLALRFDLCYRTPGVTDWETGEWLVTAGGRLP